MIQFNMVINNGFYEDEMGLYLVLPSFWLSLCYFVIKLLVHSLEQLVSSLLHQWELHPLQNEPNLNNHPQLDDTFELRNESSGFYLVLPSLIESFFFIMKLVAHWATSLLQNEPNVRNQRQLNYRQLHLIINSTFSWMEFPRRWIRTFIWPYWHILWTCSCISRERLVWNVFYWVLPGFSYTSPPQKKRTHRHSSCSRGVAILYRFFSLSSFSLPFVPPRFFFDGCVIFHLILFYFFYFCKGRWG